MPTILSSIALLWYVLAQVSVSVQAPPFPGKLVDLGGHKLHLNCTGQGTPTVVIEGGLGDFSTDWVLVQDPVAKFTRICTYDRAGYAWSTPGPRPRTFAQINLELHDALRKLGERPPYVLVGHSYGGPVVRNYAAVYPEEVAGIVLAESVSEDQRIVMGKRTLRLRDDAKGTPLPAPHEEMRAVDVQGPASTVSGASQEKLGRLYLHLPLKEQEIHLWAQSLPALENTEDNQRRWSVEYFAQMHAHPQPGILGDRPLIVLTRAEGGYADDLDLPAAQLEKERLQGQRRLAELSIRGKQTIVQAGHSLHLEAPQAVVTAIRDAVFDVRKRQRTTGTK